MAQTEESRASFACTDHVNTRLPLQALMPYLSGSAGVLTMSQLGLTTATLHPPLQAWDTVLLPQAVRPLL